MIVPTLVLVAVVAGALILLHTIADRLKNLHGEVNRLRCELMDALYPSGSTRTTDNHLAKTHEELGPVLNS